MHQPWWRRDDRIRPGIRALLFLPGLILCAALLFSLWLGWSWLTAGLTPPMLLQRITTLKANLLLSLAALITTWFFSQVIDRRAQSNLGLPLSREAFKQGFRGLLAGLGMQGMLLLCGMVTGVYLVQLRGWYPSALGEYMLAMLFVALGEELIFRGYLLRTLGESWGLRPATWLISLLFAAFHLGNAGSGWMAMIGLTAASLLMAYAVQSSGNLWSAIGLHWAWNVIEGAISGLPNSGGRFGSSLLVTLVEGPAWWTGGTFGPEAGLLSLITMPLGFLILQAGRRPQPAERSLTP